MLVALGAASAADRRTFSRLRGDGMKEGSRRFGALTGRDSSWSGASGARKVAAATPAYSHPPLRLDRGLERFARTFFCFNTNLSWR